MLVVERNGAVTVMAGKSHKGPLRRGMSVGHTRKESCPQRRAIG